MDQADLIRRHCFSNLRLKFVFTRLHVFVAFHGEGLACTRLPVGKDSAMIAVNDLLDHTFDTYLLIESTLVECAVTDFVETKRLWLLVPCIELQGDIVVG